MTTRREATRPDPRRRNPRRAASAVRVSLFTALVALALGTVAPRPALAHEEAVLEASASAVAAGGTLELTGSEFVADEEVRLRLLGALEEHELGTVTPDSAGRFRLELELPADVRQGRYQVVALASDGDEVARLDLSVTPAASGDGEDAAEGAPAGEDEARADEMEIERSRSGVEWAALLAIVGLSGGLGARLLRSAGRN